jgi:cobaltochelatase CobS
MQTQATKEYVESNIVEEVPCRVGTCTYSSHDLTEHITKVHNVTPEQYAVVTRSSPLMSEIGKDEQLRRNAEMANGQGQQGVPRRRPVNAKTAASLVRTKKQYSIRDTFGIDSGVKLDEHGKPVLDAAGQPVKRDPMVDGFAERTEYVPEIDPAYVFPIEETKIILLGIQQRDNILIVGDTGTGKTTLIEQICARINYQLIKINFDGGITRADLVGEWVVKGREMTFQLGMLPFAMEMPGTVILLDEWDTIQAETSFVLQRPLEKGASKLLILETGGQVISLHADNMFAATANTAGQGDDTGLYSQGTKVQNYAQINRFTMTIRLKYMEEKKEIEMLQKRYTTLKPQECAALVKAVNAVRTAYSNGELSVPLSTRDLNNWADKYLRLGNPLRAAKYCFINRMPPADAATVDGIIRRLFPDV